MNTKKNMLATLVQHAGFLTIIKQSPVSTQIFTPDGQTIMVNPAWEKLWGVKADKIINIYNVLQDKQLAEKKILPLLKKAFKGTTVQLPAISYEPEKTIPGLSKVDFKWVKAIAYPIHDAKGKVEYVVLQHEDITIQRHYEEALTQARNEFSVILQNVADGITAQDEEGKLVFANEVAARTNGYSSVQGFLKAPFLNYLQKFDMYDEHDKPFPHTKLPGRRALLGEKNPHALLKIVDKQTEKTKWINIKSSAILDKGKKPVMVINTMQDMTQRKLAEEKVKASEAQFRKLFESSIIGVFISTFDGLFLDANEALLSMIGYTRADLKKGRIHRDILTPSEFIQKSKEAVEALEKFGSSTPYEKEYIRKDGRRVAVLIAVAKIDDSQKCVGFVLDISQRKQMTETANRLAAIVESSDDAIVSKTLDGIITSWNRSAEKLFGYPAEEAIGQPITIIIPLELRDEEKEIIRNLRAGRRIEHFETTRVRKDGSRVIVSLSISPIQDDTGKVIGASKIARNVTEQKKAEQALRESEERLRLALQAGNIGVWDWNLEDNTLIWTDNVYAIHGVDKKIFPVTFENYQKLIHPEDRERFSSTLQKSIEEKSSFDIDFRTLLPSGAMRWVTTSAILYHDSSGKVIRMLGAVSDVTQQKQLDQDKSDFLSMASHELKTPLTSMKMFIELLQRQVNESEMEKPKYFISRIYDQANRLSELTNDLLDVSRIETGKMRMNKEQFDIYELITDAVEGIQASTKLHTIVAKNIEHIDVQADRYRLYQVLVNLLTNAIKYSGNGKDIIISAKRDKDRTIVSVQDFGIGIRKDQQTKIFDRLYQVTDPEEKTFPGLGLGLFISKEIVQRHNGKIWVESEKGKGSTFYFSLPTNTN